MFLALLCALIIPRVAWAAHMSGDSLALSASASHVHHDDHSHIVVDPEAGRSHDDGKPDSDGGLAHNHLPADVLSMMSEANAGFKNIEIAYARSTHSLDRRSDRPPAQTPGTLLRPPRTA